MPLARDNHYVPQWYQRGFLESPSDKFLYLDLSPVSRSLADGRIIQQNNLTTRSVSQCFYQTDLYTTIFGEHVNDEIERLLFGDIDDMGARSVRAFISDDIAAWHNHFTNFFSYIDTQKIRTPKGLDWIKQQYPALDQTELMVEMQAIRDLHCTLWTEGVREIVSAADSDTKFIVSDHPVTVYNYAYPPASLNCEYPDDPSIAQKGTQTIYPLNKNHCLILTNLEYANDPQKVDPTENRTNARLVRQSMVRTQLTTRRKRDSLTA